MHKIPSKWKFLIDPCTLFIFFGNTNLILILYVLSFFSFQRSNFAAGGQAQIQLETDTAKAQ